MSTDLEERPSSTPDTGDEAHDVVVEQVRTRWLLPVLVPVLAIGTLAVLAFNLSRVFLAFGKTGAIVTAAAVTLIVLFGAALLSSKPDLKTASLTLLGAIVILVVVGAGLATIGAADEHHGDEAAGGYVEPEGDADTTLEIEALNTLVFRPPSPDAPAGIIEILMVGDNGHSFRFTDPIVEGFRLVGVDVSGKVELAEGEYEFFCDIPGHREGGMEGVLTVTPGADGGAGTTEPDLTEGS